MAELFTNVKCTVEKNNITLLYHSKRKKLRFMLYLFQNLYVVDLQMP